MIGLSFAGRPFATANFASETGETKTFTGAGLWTTATNWTPSGMPGQKDTAIVAGDCLLAQAVLISDLSVNNGATLTFSNWTTRIQCGDVHILNGGDVTHAISTTNGASPCSNRVWFACSNLTVETGGAINTDASGYRGGVNEGVTQSYGQGAGGGKGSWGAGHGGIGAIGGFGGEISAEVSEHLFDHLKGPVKRMGGARIPIPFSIPLEAAYMISPDQVVEKARSFF